MWDRDNIAIYWCLSLVVVPSLQITADLVSPNIYIYSTRRRYQTVSSIFVSGSIARAIISLKPPQSFLLNNPSYIHQHCNMLFLSHKLAGVLCHYSCSGVWIEFMCVLCWFAFGQNCATFFRSHTCWFARSDLIVDTACEWTRRRKAIVIALWTTRAQDCFGW